MGFMGEREEDDVLDGAAEARAVEGAASWSCRVGHLSGGGDAVRSCWLVFVSMDHHSLLYSSGKP